MRAWDDTSEAKGYAFLSYVTSMREKPALWASVRSELSKKGPDALAFFDSEIYANQWYPRAHLHALLHALDEVSHGDEAVFRELGAASAEYQIGTIYRAFLAFLTPALVFRRAGSIWRRQSTAGSFSVVADEPDHLVGLLDDPTTPVQLPKVMAGWSDRVIIMLHKRPIPTKVTAAGRGKFEFLVSWK